MTAILTGSRAYGTPRGDSDTDLVVNVEPECLEALTASADSVCGDIVGDKYPNASRALRFGRLNLICTTSNCQWDAWQVGTANCEKRKPLSRADAVAEMIAAGVR